MPDFNSEFQILGPVVIGCQYCDTLIPVPVWARLDSDEIEFRTDTTDFDAHMLFHEVV